MDEAVRVDLLFPRSGQRLEVVLPRAVASAASGDTGITYAVCVSIGSLTRAVDDDRGVAPPSSS